jgi:hypothetical protein
MERKKNINTDTGKDKASFSWIIISVIAFLICLGASTILIFFGKELNDLGIAGNFYYIILIPLGFSCAAFLAGAMKSYASFKSNESLPYGKLNLSGPIVIFCLVVGGGFIMPNFGKDSKSFDLELNIVREDKPHELLNEGKISLRIPKGYKQIEDIHNGQAVFKNIPMSYYNKKIIVETITGIYEISDTANSFKSNDENIEIVLKRTQQSLQTRVKGSIVDNKDRPIANALLDFGNGTATGLTDSNGNFNLELPVPPGERIYLKVILNNVVKFEEPLIVASDIPVNIKLQ